MAGEGGLGVGVDDGDIGEAVYGQARRAFGFAVKEAIRGQVSALGQR
jgi:hypothetical protein